MQTIKKQNKNPVAINPGGGIKTDFDLSIPLHFPSVHNTQTASSQKDVTTAGAGGRVGWPPSLSPLLLPGNMTATDTPSSLPPLSMLGRSQHHGRLEARPGARPLRPPRLWDARGPPDRPDGVPGGGNSRHGPRRSGVCSRDPESGSSAWGPAASENNFN